MTNLQKITLNILYYLQRRSVVMKKYLINKLMCFIKDNNEYDEVKLSEIKYGFEVLYLTLTKIFVIYLISIILHTTKELSLIFLFYGILRLTGFGLHANKSIECWISSILIFVIIPLIVKFLEIPLYLRIIVSLIMIILLIKYAPADTKKRPLINEKKRKIYKIITAITSIVYFIINIIIKNPLLQNIIMFSMFIQVIVVLPISYKLFGLTYNNYLYYKRKGGSNT